MSLTITLNKAEQLIAIHLALERTNNARANGIKNKRMGNQPDWITDLDGIGGELAAAKYFQVYPDTAIVLNLPTYDLLTRSNKRVDVKTTKHKAGQLLATLKKKTDDCDIFVLVVGEFPEYTLVGWSPSEDLIKQANIKDLGHGKGYALSQSQLRKFPSAN